MPLCAVLCCARGKLSDTFTASMWQVQTHLATHDQFHINDVQMFTFVSVDINIGMHGTLQWVRLLADMFYVNYDLMTHDQISRNVC